MVRSLPEEGGGVRFGEGLDKALVAVTRSGSFWTRKWWSIEGRMCGGSGSIEMEGLFKECSLATLLESERFISFAWLAERSCIGETKSLGFFCGSRGTNWGSKCSASEMLLPQTKKYRSYISMGCSYYLYTREMKKLVVYLWIDHFSFFFFRRDTTRLQWGR